MILNIHPILQRIRETDFASASPAKAQAIHGILDTLGAWVEDSQELTTKLTALNPQLSIVNAQLSTLNSLHSFYLKDIHQLSHGDDSKAHQLLEDAECTFQQCRKEVFEDCGSHIEEFLFYFHVLCLAHPGYRHPDHVRLYLDYDRFFNVLPIEDYDPDSDLVWQYQEVRWRRDMLHEQHFDRSLLMGLTFVDPSASEAFRLQCYKWMLSLDPEYDGSIQEQHQNNRFLSECIQRIHNWLRAKYDNHINIDPQTEASALLTLYCGINTAIDTFPSLPNIEEKAYDLLDNLPDSKLKIHLMAQIALNNEDPDLTDTVQSDITTWDQSHLTQEDTLLIELLS